VSSPLSTQISLQETINSLHDWSQKTGFTFSAEKSLSISFSILTISRHFEKKHYIHRINLLKSIDHTSLGGGGEIYYPHLLLLIMNNYSIILSTVQPFHHTSYVLQMLINILILDVSASII